MASAMLVLEEALQRLAAKLGIPLVERKNSTILEESDWSSKAAKEEEEVEAEAAELEAGEELEPPAKKASPTRKRRAEEPENAEMLLRQKQRENKAGKREAAKPICKYWMEGLCTKVRGKKAS